MDSNHQSRAIRRADRIRAVIPVVDVLMEYGYAVRDGGGREQQFACNLHGDGVDGTPSARVYPSSNNWYCWGCQITRDSIATVRENTTLDFFGALKLLETKWGLSPLPWLDEDQKGPQKPSARAAVEAALRSGKTFADDLKRFKAMLDGAVTDRDIPLVQAVAFWEAFDKIVWHVRGPKGKGDGPWDENTGRVVLEQLRRRFREAS